MKVSIKRTIAIILAVIFVVAAVSCISAAAVPEFLYGDTNEDGVINVRDVSYIQKVLAEVETETMEFRFIADVYQDMSVDVRDVTTLQKYIAGIYTQLPVHSEITAPTEPDTRPTLDPMSTDPDGWHNHIIKP